MFFFLKKITHFDLRELSMNLTDSRPPPHSSIWPPLGLLIFNLSGKRGIFFY